MSLSNIDNMSASKYPPLTIKQLCKCNKLVKQHLLYVVWSVTIWRLFNTLHTTDP